MMTSFTGNFPSQYFGQVYAGGSLFFLLYITVLCPIVLFSDDSHVLASHGSYEKLFQTINTEQPLVNDWFKVNIHLTVFCNIILKPLKDEDRHRALRIVINKPLRERRRPR